MVDAAEIAPGLEVADHHVGLEVVGDVEIGLDVLRPAARDGALDVLEERLEVPHLVVFRHDGEAPDLLHRQMLAGPLRQIVVGAARDHHLDVVLLHQLVEDDARADGVAHALADDAVEDAHAAILTLSRRCAPAPAAWASAACRRWAGRRAGAPRPRPGAARWP